MQATRKPSKVFGFLVLFGAAVIFFLGLFRSLLAAPVDFPVPYHLTVDPGQTLFSVSHELAADHVITSPRLFEIFMISFGSEKKVSEGEYYFDQPQNALEVAMRISGRQFGIDRQKVTFPEGFSTKEMAARLGATFPAFDTELFLELAKDDQGRLFPDTYGFFPTVKPDLVLTTLKRTFVKKVPDFAVAVAASGKTEHEILTMASIIEKEANGDEDRKIVAGILWKRISIGMPLQVDAPFLYLLGKESKELTKKDLAMKSPYNTYINKGLPPTPINNPGLLAIEAALHPVESPYLYYLHDSSGAIHYASTYKQHQANIQKYLK